MGGVNSALGGSSMGGVNSALGGSSMEGVNLILGPSRMGGVNLMYGVRLSVWQQVLLILQLKQACWNTPYYHHILHYISPIKIQLSRDSS